MELCKKRFYNDPLVLVLKREASTLTVVSIILFKADFRSRSCWESEDTFFLKIVKISDASENIKKIFFVAEFTMVSRIEIVFSLQRSLKTRCMISLSPFY